MLSTKQEVSPPILEVEVTVGEIVGSGEGQYVFTYPTKNDVLPKGTSITLSTKNWKGSMELQKGQVILLKNIQKFAKGFRAFEAEEVSLHTVTSKKQKGGDV